MHASPSSSPCMRILIVPVRLPVLQDGQSQLSTTVGTNVRHLAACGYYPCDACSNWSPWDKFGHWWWRRLKDDGFCCLGRSYMMICDGPWRWFVIVTAMSVCTTCTRPLSEKSVTNVRSVRVDVNSHIMLLTSALTSSDRYVCLIQALKCIHFRSNLGQKLSI